MKIATACLFLISTLLTIVVYSQFPSNKIVVPFVGDYADPTIIRDGDKCRRVLKTGKSYNYLKLGKKNYEIAVYCGDDGKNWEMLQAGMDVSGFHHNMLRGF